MNTKKDETIFGIYPLQEALASDITFDKVFVQQGHNNDKIDELVRQMEALNITINPVPKEKLNRLTRGNHQGIVGLTSPIRFYDLVTVVETALSTHKTPLFIILDQISDVRNFGAILRTAECTGVDGVIIPKSGGAPITGDTVKASAGAIFNVPISKVDHIKDAIYYMQASGIKTIAATEKTDQNLYALDFKEPLAIVMGSEGKGISHSVLSLVDEKASLPLLGEVNSLNVSVACGAFLYEIIRQRNH
jgi:23S rRNA (guanosine2251-2'-O)-methyltransferase